MLFALCAGAPMSLAKASPILVDVAIVGTGVAGLWLGNLLTRRGLAVALCDPGPLGGVQTAMSQGIIHGGVKYALGGARRSAWLAAMPARWRACLAGRDDVDLRGTKVASETVHVVSVRAGAKLRTLLARQVVSGGVKRVAAAPPLGGGMAYASSDFALDVPSLVRRLAAAVRHRVLTHRVDAEAVVPGPRGVAGLRLGGRVLQASAYVFAAGAGNAALAERVGAKASMRLRPLRQICVWPRAPAPPVYAHCLAKALGVEPDLTVTTHGPALYLGGKVANFAGERRRPRDDAGRIALARALLTEHLPGLDLTGAKFKVVAADRAEPAAAPLGEAFVARRGNAFVCWPIKLSLAPRLGDRMLAALAGLRPRAASWPGDPAAPCRYASPPYMC